DNVYVQTFRCGVIPSASTELAIRPFAEWLASRDQGAWVSGPALVKLRERLPADGRGVPPEEWDPRPESLLRLGLPRYVAGERDDIWKLEPLYLRPSSAEEKWTAMGR